MEYKKVGKNKYRKKNWFERHEMISCTLMAIALCATVSVALFI